jgi:Spo0E like sporulation regulatory protein
MDINCKINGIIGFFYKGVRIIMVAVFPIESIESKIELYRKKLIDLGLRHGFNSTETLIASQNLDKLILEYQTRRN